MSLEFSLNSLLIGSCKLSIATEILFVFTDLYINKAFGCVLNDVKSLTFNLQVGF